MQLLTRRTRRHLRRGGNQPALAAEALGKCKCSRWQKISWARFRARQRKSRSPAPGKRMKARKSVQVSASHAGGLDPAAVNSPARSGINRRASPPGGSPLTNSPENTDRAIPASRRVRINALRLFTRPNNEDGTRTARGGAGIGGKARKHTTALCASILPDHCMGRHLASSNKHADLINASSPNCSSQQSTRMRYLSPTAPFGAGLIAHCRRSWPDSQEFLARADSRLGTNKGPRPLSIRSACAAGLEAMPLEPPGQADMRCAESGSDARHPG